MVGLTLPLSSVHALSYNRTNIDGGYQDTSMIRTVGYDTRVVRYDSVVRTSQNGVVTTSITSTFFLNNIKDHVSTVNYTATVGPANPDGSIPASVTANINGGPNTTVNANVQPNSANSFAGMTNDQIAYAAFKAKKLML